MGNKCSVAQATKASGDKGGVLCFGHPLLDMMAPATEAFMSEYGIASGSVNLAQPEQLPVFQRISEDMAEVVDYVPGGAAMNTARTLSWVRPGLPVSYVGALGKDRYAEILKSSLAKAGVRPLFEEHSGKPTGTCACLVLEKERALLANLGAAVDLSLAFLLREPVQRCIADASVYYAEGFFLNTASSPDGLLSVATHARETGKTFCFNLNAPYISLAFKDHIDLLMPFIDILFGSAEDIMSYATLQWPKEFTEPTSPFTTDNHISNSDNSDSKGAMDGEGGSQGPSPSPQEDAGRLRSAVQRIADMPTHGGVRRLVVATCGAGSTVVGSTGREDVREFPVPPMSPEEMVDSNGAGDAFVGGFLAQYMLVRDEAACAIVGHATAQNCIRHNGAVVGGAVPTLVHGRIGKQNSPSRS